MYAMKLCAFTAAILSLSACSTSSSLLPAAPSVATAEEAGAAGYLIGPGDMVQVFVWRSPELSTTVRVRPDGRISVPLIDDLVVAGKAPTDIARDIEIRLGEYVQAPKVTVIMQDFVGPPERQIRVVGQAAKPQAIPYRRGMTVLDVVIAAGGLTPFAAGNEAVIMRGDAGREAGFRVRLADLMRNGDVSANVQVAPGDVLMIPESWF